MDARRPPPSLTSRRSFAALLLVFGVAWLGSLAATRAGAETGAPGGCVATRVRGVDADHGDRIQLIRASRGLAQTFMASDTLVRSVTVWVSASRTAIDLPIRLLILPTGAGGQPLPDAPIADGGELDTGDGSGAVTARFTFTFDPPAMLPAPGLYALVVMPAHCNVIPMLADDGDDYPEGELWELVAHQCNGRPPTLGGRVSGIDLAFRVEFCEGGTATTGRTWGELKTLYR